MVVVALAVLRRRGSLLLLLLLLLRGRLRESGAPPRAHVGHAASRADTATATVQRRRGFQRSPRGAPAHIVFCRVRVSRVEQRHAPPGIVLLLLLGASSVARWLDDHNMQVVLAAVFLVQLLLLLRLRIPCTRSDANFHVEAAASSGVVPRAQRGAPPCAIPTCSLQNKRTEMKRKRRVERLANKKRDPCNRFLNSFFVIAHHQLDLVVGAADVVAKALFQPLLLGIMSVLLILEEKQRQVTLAGERGTERDTLQMLASSESNPSATRDRRRHSKGAPHFGM